MKTETTGISEMKIASVAIEMQGLVTTETIGVVAATDITGGKRLRYWLAFVVMAIQSVMLVTVIWVRARGLCGDGSHSEGSGGDGKVMRTGSDVSVSGDGSGSDGIGWWWR